MAKKLLLRFFWHNKITYVLGLIFVFLSSYVQTLFPKVLGITVDKLRVVGFDKNIILLNIGYIVLVSAAAFLFTYVWRRLVIGNARKMECHIREHLYGHFQKLSSAFYSKRKTGDLIAYAINDISAVRMAFGPATAMSVNAIFICAVSIYTMCTSVNPILTLITLFPIPLIVFLMLKIGKVVQGRFNHVQKNFSLLSGKIQESIYGIRVIKSYVQEEQEIKQFDDLSGKMMDSNIRMVRASSVLSPLIELSFSISFFLSLFIGSHMVMNGTITLGDFVAFNSYLVLIMTPIISIGRITTIIYRGLASLGRLNDILSEEPEIKENESSPSSVIKGDIEFKNLSFSYPGTCLNTLKNIDLKIPAGSTVGIIGKSGSGKTTLCNLLFKLYNVEPGKLFIDGKDINEYALNNLRESFGFVPQDVFLFSATIKENINFNKDIYSDDELINASEISHIHNSIAAFPDGYETKLGERGVNLSGGQKQRIAIARAVIKKPSILVLDDALAAVDTITEAQILQKLKEFRKSETTLIISHRISAISDADIIIVLDKGCICEIGTHQELLSKEGQYYAIYQEQVSCEENVL